MYGWWSEDGGDKAWWVIESVFLGSPDKGFWACLGDQPPDIPRQPETWISLYYLIIIDTEKFEKQCTSGAFWCNLEIKLTCFNGNFHSCFGLPYSWHTTHFGDMQRGGGRGGGGCCRHPKNPGYGTDGSRILPVGSDFLVFSEEKQGIHAPIK